MQIRLSVMISCFDYLVRVIYTEQSHCMYLGFVFIFDVMGILRFHIFMVEKISGEFLLRFNGITCEYWQDELAFAPPGHLI